MPRHIIRPGAGRTAHAKLVHDLAQELSTPAGKPMPYVLEVEVPATGLRTVTVIWDRWKGVREEDRSDVILAAYAAAEGKEYVDSIALPSGFTPAEALALGYLPYKIEPLRRTTDPTSEADYRRVVGDEASRTVLGKSAKELRYPRVEDAHEAYERVTKHLPGTHWAVVQETRPD